MVKHSVLALYGLVIYQIMTGCYDATVQRGPITIGLRDMACGLVTDKVDLCTQEPFQLYSPTSSMNLSQLYSPTSGMNLSPV